MDREARLLEAKLLHFFAGAHRVALRLDIDGANAALIDNPEEVCLYEHVAERVDELQELGVDVAWVTGRSVESAKRILAPLKRPQVIWGCHGWQMLVGNGELKQVPLAVPESKALEEVMKWETDIKHYGGRCEPKHACIAVHWRGCSGKQISAIKKLVSKRLKGDIAFILKSRPMNGGLELYVPGRDKGSVIERAHEGGVDAVVHIGDDHTDEDAFRTIRHLRQRNATFCGLGVLIRHPRINRKSDADIEIRSMPDGLLAFYDKLIAARRHYQESVLSLEPQPLRVVPQQVCAN